MVDESHGLPLIAATKADQGEEAHGIERVEQDEVRYSIDNSGTGCLLGLWRASWVWL
jgi:hypothetical protein